MTDDARIARLTELAQRVWPRAEAYEHGEIVDVGVQEARGYRLTLRIWHPRALDALEAALLVLANGTEARVISALDIRMDDTLGANAERLGCPVEALTALLDAHKAWEREPPAWVEQLASEWEREADKITGVPGVPRGEEPVFRHCAAELRERAKGKGP